VEEDSWELGMLTKRMVIFLASGICAFVVLFYFLVPVPEIRAKVTSKRLGQFIEPFMADAQILNPVLSADAASSAIESKVFEGLVGRDENLRFRGRLATHWEIFEEAYFYVNHGATIPGVGRADAEGVAGFLRKAIRTRKQRDDPLSRSLANIEKIEVLPPRTFWVSRQEKGRRGEGVTARIGVGAPPRIRLVLKEVDQGLFDHLSKVLGGNYFSSFDGARFIQVQPERYSSERPAYGRELLPATEHNPVIVFHLRPDVKFHDGHVFDAYDVEFTYGAIMDPRNLSPRMPDYEPIKAVEVIDPLTIRIVYKELYSPGLSTWGIGILPAHLLADGVLRREAKRRGIDPKTFTLRQSEFNRRPIGCGPFKFDRWKRGRYIRLRRFDHYWEGAPEFQEYICRIIPDPRAQAREFFAGELDVYGPFSHGVEALEKDKRFQSFSGLGFGYTYIGYNMRREPFKDRRVRRALGMAIDVEHIIREVMGNQGERITGPFTKGTDFYNHAVKPLPYDPKRALGLLAKAGWKRGRGEWLEKGGKRFRFTLITHRENPGRKAIASIVRDSWRKIGIDVRTEALDWTVFIRERVNKLDFDALILGWAMGVEPDVYPIWHSSQVRPNQLNFVGFQDEEADHLIVKIRREYDHDRQVAYCHRLHEIIAEEQPHTFLFVDTWTVFLDKRIVIKDVGPDGTVRYSRIKPTKTGSYGFHFNKWVKLPELPEYLRE
jgi:ABC-type transport system substrate-binding protein